MGTWKVVLRDPDPDSKHYLDCTIQADSEDEALSIARRQEHRYLVADPARRKYVLADIREEHAAEPCDPVQVEPDPEPELDILVELDPARRRRWWQRQRQRRTP